MAQLYYAGLVCSLRCLRSCRCGSFASHRQALHNDLLAQLEPRPWNFAVTECHFVHEAHWPYWPTLTLRMKLSGPLTATQKFGETGLIPQPHDSRNIVLEGNL